MIALQKPVALFSSTPSYSSRSNHSRHPSAPAVIRPTQTPGLLSLSKPISQPSSRPQQAHQYARAPRSSPKSKSQRSTTSVSAATQPAPVGDDKKPSAHKQRAATPPSDRALTSGTSVPSLDKPGRGRQPSKPAPKNSVEPRTSISSSRSHARRLPRQPSPSPVTRTPQQPHFASRSTVNHSKAKQSVRRDSDSNSFDLFFNNSTSDSENSEYTQTVAKGGDKPSFHTPPLASRPTGNLARRRQSGPAAATPTSSKALPVPRSKDTLDAFNSVDGRRSSTLSAPNRSSGRRVSAGLPLADWDAFPVREDLVTPPSTPVRESASVPAKRTGVTWQQTLLDEPPRTAPLSSTFTNYPFTSVASFTTPPAQRRRHHRIPSDGVFAMSTDEDVSSDSSDELKKAASGIFPLHHGRVAHGDRRSPSPMDSDDMPANFYAASAYQNSPSPDDLPVPAFRA